MSNTTIKNGGPAFPSLYPRSDEDGRQGMSLRDYFAGQALAGLVAHNDYGCISDQDVANGAYCYADAMIAAREVKP